MARNAFPILIVALVLAASPAAGEQRRPISTADFDGWQHSGAGRFEASVRSGRVVYSTDGGMGLLWLEEPSDDFRLALRFKVSKHGGNSGVFLRVPDPKSEDYVSQSFEVQIDPRGTGTSATGAIYDVQPPLVPIVPEPGLWYRMVIRAEGTHIRVSIDGTLVNDFEARTGGKVTSYELNGHLGLQNHSDVDLVRFRGIRLRML